MEKPKTTFGRYRNVRTVVRMNDEGKMEYRTVGECFDSEAEMHAHIDKLWGKDVIEAALKAAKPCDWDKPTLKFRPTLSQTRMLRALARDILRHDGLGPQHMEKYEYKQFEITYTARKRIFLVATVGRKEDEGTMASVFARTHRHAVIGPRGGIESFYGPKAKAHGYSNFMIYGKDK